MLRNTAAKFIVYCFDSTTGLPKTGDAANLTAYVSKDYGAVTVLADTSATEMDATNAKGYYLFDAAQGETDADCLLVSGKSSTANIVVIGAPAVIYTRPQTGWLAPTTAGRTLDVSAGGEAGIDWANIGSPTTAVNLSATNIDVDQVVASVSGAVGSVTGNVGGNVVGSVASVTARVTANTDQLAGQTVTAAAGVTFPTSVASPTNITAGTITTVTNLTNAPTAGDLTATMKASVNAEVDTAIADAALATAANLATVDTVVDAIKVTTDKLDDTLEDDAGTYRFTANALEEAPTAPTAAAIADAVWEEAIADHSGTVGSTAEQLAAAGAAGDPWATALPGAYSSGTAGKIVGDNINATISSRATQTSVDDVPTNAELATALGTADDAVLAAIAALNNLSAAGVRTAVGLASANLDTQLDALPTNAELATALGTADDAVLAQVALVKAKTDLIPASPAAVGDIPTATENADALLKRDWTAITGEADRSLLNAGRWIRNGFTISGTTASILKEDDVSVAYTRQLATDPDADPITGVS